MSLRNVYMSQVSVDHKGNPYKYFPYSVGCIWAYAATNQTIIDNYALKEFLFLREDIDKVVDRLDSPDVMAFSLYMWNENYNLRLAELVKQKFPNCLIIAGGPSVPENSENYLKKFPFIDLCVHNEGEHTFEQILLSRLSESPNYEISNVSFLRDNYYKGKFQRINDLDNLPSPYTTGLFDDMLKKHPDVEFNMTLETHRGCPFSCTFCDWGSLTTAKVKKSSLSRVFEELAWAADNQIEFINIADANFGIFLERDNLIVDKMIELKDKKGFPRVISTSWNKNMKLETLELAKKLLDAGLFRRFTASVQTINDDSLVAIKRKNTDGSNFNNILLTARDYGIPISTETIVGLPLETYDSYLELVEFILSNDMPYVYSHLQILKNSEMAKKSYIEKYGLDVIRAESSFSDDYAKEYEHIVVGTKDLPRDKMFKLYLYQWYVFFFNELHLMDVITKTISKLHGVKISEVYNDYLEYILATPTHMLHNDFKYLSDPLKNNCLAVLDNYYNKEHTRILGKVFNNPDFYADLKNFCILKYGTDSDVIDDAIVYQTNAVKYEKAYSEKEVEFKTTLYDFLQNKNELKKVPIKYLVKKDAIPSHFPTWYSFLRSYAWGRGSKSVFVRQ